jgi:hypothetical protein
VSLPANRIYLFDTSIWDYTDHPLITADWDAALCVRNYDESRDTGEAPAA